jgi:hypothetical protein
MAAAALGRNVTLSLGWSRPIYPLRFTIYHPPQAVALDGMRLRAM